MMATTSLFGFFSVLLAIPLLTTCSATPQAGSPAIGHEVRLERAEYTSANGVTVLPMDVYIPAAPSGAGVIAVHGGGWLSGTRRMMRGFCKRLAANGTLCFAPEYRLAPADPWPAAYRDLRAAVSNIRRNAATWGLDPKRLGGFGTSAGGNLAALLAATGDLNATASWSGPMDLTTILVQGCPCSSQVERYAPTEASKLAASPVSHVGPATPPMLIINSEDEIIPLAQAQEMAASLNAAGVSHRLIVVPGTRHAIAYFIREVSVTVRWLESHL